jgi:superfamily II DNA/RNA helicase
MIKSVFTNIFQKTFRVLSRSNSESKTISNYLYYNRFLQKTFSRKITYSFSNQADPNTNVADKSFEDKVTNPHVLKRLTENQMTSMFPIQYESFNFILEGRDMLASDRTGSGKTLAYTLPVL